MTSVLAGLSVFFLVSSSYSLLTLKRGRSIENVTQGSALLKTHQCLHPISLREEPKALTMASKTPCVFTLGRPPLCPHLLLSPGSLISSLWSLCSSPDLPGMPLLWVLCPGCPLCWEHPSANIHMCAPHHLLHLLPVHPHTCPSPPPATSTRVPLTSSWHIHTCAPSPPLATSTRVPLTSSWYIHMRAPSPPPSLCSIIAFSRRHLNHSPQK